MKVTTLDTCLYKEVRVETFLKQFPELADFPLEKVEEILGWAMDAGYWLNASDRKLSYEKSPRLCGSCKVEL